MAKKKTPPRPAHRPLELTDAVSRDIVRRIKLGMTVERAAQASGFGERIVYEWLRRGREGDAPIFMQFLRATSAALAEREERWLAALDKAAEPKRGKGDWKAASWKLEHTNARDYGTRVRVMVEEQLEGAITRLKGVFADEPETLERALAAIAGVEGGARTLGDALDSREGGGAEGAAVGEALGAESAEPATAVVSPT